MPSAELGALDAVTIDGFGTLLELTDPVEALDRALRARGVERERTQIGAAFAEEVRYYRPRAVSGRDRASLAALRRDCVGVFLGALGVELDGFTDAYMEALRFRPVAGALDTVRALRAHGLALAVVANWDVGLHDTLAELAITPLVDAVVTSAEVGVAKPDPRIFRVALEQLGVAAARALHVGDEDVDEQGARAAGMRFAPAPLRSLL